MKKILLQTTIPYAKDDWSIERFSMLAEVLSDARDSSGNRQFQVICRNRENNHDGDDRVLSRLDTSDFEQLWLFGVDAGGGISANDCAAIGRFRKRGGGLLTSRDHQDLGISFCTLGGIGSAHHFHSKNQESNPSRREIEDTETANISWPNYHSGSNGDYQRVAPIALVHPVIHRDNQGKAIEYLPAHPHEAAISSPAQTKSRVIATGVSTITGREFNLIVAFEADGPLAAPSQIQAFTIFSTITSIPAADARLSSPNKPVKPFARLLRRWRMQEPISEILPVGSPE
ncbi:MAG: hypothetical protein ABSD75_31230 [Terriglobales bacterium]